MYCRHFSAPIWLMAVFGARQNLWFIVLFGVITAQVTAWAGQFPCQVLLLVDSIAWTSSTNAALHHLAEGTPRALHALHDSAVLRLESLAVAVQTQGHGTSSGSSSCSVPDSANQPSHSTRNETVESSGKGTNGSVVQQEKGLEDQAFREAIQKDKVLHKSQCKSSAETGGSTAQQCSIPKHNSQCKEGSATFAAEQPKQVHSNSQQQHKQQDSKPAAVSLNPPLTQAANQSSDAGGKQPCSRSPVGSSASTAGTEEDSNGPQLGSGVSAPREELGGIGFRVGLTASELRGLQVLVTAGIAHREVVLQLLEAKVESADCFEWRRALRHYWDPDSCTLKVGNPDLQEA